ncbi:MAG: NUDIX domain-containing protein [Nitrospirae bacterium]|nr:NUDIX domain-containing protein [Nitrospirota bacterium]MBF0533739.1 NUDIX domain-containing protein [Nitrospirota bacterium]MBF0615552.1 NUDIX domain-containing protein [Nitrospirota bacterium]
MNDVGNDLLEVVTPDGDIIGSALRKDVHGNNKLLHRVVHVFVFNNRGELLLQQRSLNKDVAPGKWDTSVGGHVDFGESIEVAMQREMEEELGIASDKNVPVFLYKYIHSNDYESELVYSYSFTHDGQIVFNKDEIESVKYYPIREIEEKLGTGLFSDNFEHEFHNYLRLVGFS